ncbi:MAG: transcription-repair coupling factor [Verrucomicrobia bacterium]|nr:transcription-repair coupling factor [Verrucomicrobiota bacterium]
MTGKGLTMVAVSEEWTGTDAIDRSAEVDAAESDDLSMERSTPAPLPGGELASPASGVSPLAGVNFVEAEGTKLPSLEGPGVGSSLATESDRNSKLCCGSCSPVSAPLHFGNLDAFRPLGDRPPEPQVAEVQRREFFNQLHRWLRQGFQVHVFCNNEGERQRFQEIWQEYGLNEKTKVPETESDSNGPNSPLSTLHSPLSTHLGALSRGFLYESGKLAIITDAEIFGRYKVQRPRRLKSPHAVAARSALDIDFTDLEEGDHVVHLQHGIGRYLGLRMLPVGAGRKGGGPSAEAQETGQECLVIEYAAGDPDHPPPRLYVPVTEAYLVSKYVGAGKARPALNTLGGARWAKAKAQAEEAVRDLAAELLAIQAARESQAGHAFASDTPWQREFESAFLYEETPDQDRAIVETKKDMETARPMDRLICGDVGYGKTEVALRAAFKAVLDGRQVAVLVPTTILAQQHFNTFRERMADYPVRVEQLSRFCGRQEQRRIVEQLANGSVDIVIGTHRLLQGDISFKDLGLVVIDEEQRFGVLHKEKLKRLRMLVDVLTLSATPIPRTLYLALTGARDMSTIETPPQDRLPVRTLVAQYDERMVRDAIQREINRQGQVYYLHNRVQDIESVALRIQALVPNARIIVGHGQMDSDQLEEVMTRFVSGEADVLVCTTIIESGIDIPNANTIIIDRADRFGLSDLYQLRGRVGRYKHQAYAYLLLPRHAALLSDVRKRISAIRQYSSLGSGFKIAMRDLEIRGAGNLLGPEQSGHITAVGFELYCQLLKQSVSSLKGEKVKPRVEVQVRFDFLALHPGEEEKSEAQDAMTRAATRKPALRINVPREVAAYGSPEEAPLSKSEIRNQKSEIKRASAYIPFRFVSEARQRIEVYRKLAQVTDKPSLERLRAELRDRFGELPRAMEILLLVTELKCLASERGITALETKEEKLMLTRNNDYITLAGKFPRLTKKDARSRLLEIKKLLLAL